MTKFRISENTSDDCNYGRGSLFFGRSRQRLIRLGTSDDQPWLKLANAGMASATTRFRKRSANGDTARYAFCNRPTNVCPMRYIRRPHVRRFVAEIDSRLRLPKLDFPEHPIDSPEAAERAAEKCRSHWGLGLGPISNMVRVLENAGAVVTVFHSSAKEIDALSIASSRPIVVTNRSDTSACRVRFGHAHECGHFVGHVGRKTGDRASESEANRFASALLLPRSSFVKEFPALRGGTQINWHALSELKQRWRVSKAAMLYRARQLNLLSEEQYKRAVLRHLFAKGERHNEHEDASIPHEKPELLHNAMTVLREKLGLYMRDIAEAVHVSSELLAEIAPLVEEDLGANKGVISLGQFRQLRGKTIG